MSDDSPKKRVTFEETPRTDTATRFLGALKRSAPPEAGCTVDTQALAKALGGIERALLDIPKAIREVGRTFPLAPPPSPEPAEIDASVPEPPASENNSLDKDE